MIAKGKIMKIDIPTIYEEDIIEFTQRDGNVIFKYTADSIIEIVFKTVYKFDYVEFDYIRDLEWVFGLELQEDSSYMKNFISSIPKEQLDRAFGGEYEKLQHYKLVIDDVGIYNIICKGIILPQAM